MTRTDVYCNVLDRQVIGNRDWRNGKMRYIKIGSKVYVDNDIITEINMLDEKDSDQWVLGGQITKWQKFKFRVRLLLQIWRQTKCLKI